MTMGCVVNTSFEDTQFRCARTGECPAPLECDGEFCRLPSEDAGPTSDASNVSCPGPDADGDITALRADMPPTIDGTLEAAWSRARFVEFANPMQSDNSVRVRILWDEANLYFAYEVTDAQLEAVSEPNQIFRDDGSEIYLDMAHDETPSINGDDVHFIMNIDGVVQSGTIDVAVLTTAGGYVIEHALSWSEAGAQPVAGDTVGLLLGNNDRDSDTSTQFDWRGLINSGLYTRPNLWGDLHVSGQPASLCPND